MNKPLSRDLLKAPQATGPIDSQAVGVEQPDNSWIADKPELYDDFSELQKDGAPRAQIEKLRRIHRGLSSIETLSKIQTSFIDEECLATDNQPSKPLSKAGQDNLAQAITLLSGYLANDVFEVAKDLVSDTAKRSQ
jgi:hypothetical protein